MQQPSEPYYNAYGEQLLYSHESRSNSKIYEHYEEEE
jgi:hypothetical protein